MTLDDWESAAKKSAASLFEKYVLCQKSSVPRDSGSLFDTALMRSSLLPGFS